ncbi:MAG: four helix bundle protein [Chitinophagaceae bacterium]|nr:four helix bundle protein [Chitinophagaceae bacterium]MCZ2340087.1 four helix bundle protein [Chitinophagales bacterium]
MEKNDNWLNYKIEIRDKLKLFSLRILEVSKTLSGSPRLNVVNYQLTKSGTSVYANYRAAMRARSKAEFYSKLSISVEEADETEMWIDLIIGSKMMESKEIKDLYEESLSLVKILASMRKRLG